MRRLSLLLCLLLSLSACDVFEFDADATELRFEGEGYAFSDLHARFGDEAAWHEAAFDASDWSPLGTWLWASRDTMGAFWIRSDVQIKRPLTGTEPQALYLSLLGSTEVYWDGHLLGRNGRVGTHAAAEEPGRLIGYFYVPDSLLAPGSHHLAVRASSFHSGQRMRFYGVALGDYGEMLRDPLRANLLPILLMGGFLIVAAYFLGLYLLDRSHTTHLVFGLLVLAVALLIAVEGARWVVNYPYPWHFVRLQVVAAVTVAVALLLPLYFMLLFDVARKLTWLVPLGLVIVVALALPVGFDTKSLFIFWGTLLASAAVTGRAAWQRRRGGLLALAAVAGGLVALWMDRYRFLDYSFFLTFGGLVVFGLAALTVQRREREREARLVAIRLETALLKRHLRPHFLMNTLTAVMEWVEEAPATASRFVGALADELRRLSAVADKPSIKVADELALCRDHLAVMGYRQMRCFDLQTEDVDPDREVPPALFHTLLENALTHNRYDVDPVCFHLREEPLPGGRRYVLRAPLGHAAPDRPGSGTGLRYVRARLAECYGQRWRLADGPDDGWWVTTIDILAS